MCSGADAALIYLQEGVTNLAVECHTHTEESGGLSLVLFSST